MRSGRCVFPAVDSGRVLDRLAGLGQVITPMYAVQPLPERLVAFWIVGGVIEMTVAGLILGTVYRVSRS